MSSPFSYQEIEAWMRLTGNDPTAEEIELLIMADRIYNAEMEKKT